MPKDDLALILSRLIGSTNPETAACGGCHADAGTSTEIAAVADPQSRARHLTQIDVARRWRMSERTLERWRWLGQGPPYLKIGGRVVYRLNDILEFEAAQLRKGDV